MFLGTDTNVGCEGDAWHSRGGKKNTMENKEEWRKKREEWNRSWEGEVGGNGKGERWKKMRKSEKNI